MLCFCSLLQLPVRKLPFCQLELLQQDGSFMFLQLGSLDRHTVAGMQLPGLGECEASKLFCLLGHKSISSPGILRSCLGLRVCTLLQHDILSMHSKSQPLWRWEQPATNIGSLLKACESLWLPKLLAA